MPKIPDNLKPMLSKPKDKEPVCKACEDTGKASNGQPCYPCVMAKRVK